MQSLTGGSATVLLASCQAKSAASCIRLTVSVRLSSAGALGPTSSLSLEGCPSGGPSGRKSLQWCRNSRVVFHWLLGRLRSAARVASASLVALPHRLLLSVPSWAADQAAQGHMQARDGAGMAAMGSGAPRRLECKHDRIAPAAQVRGCHEWRLPWMEGCRAERWWAHAPVPMIHCEQRQHEHGVHTCDGCGCGPPLLRGAAVPDEGEQGGHRHARRRGWQLPTAGSLPAESEPRHARLAAHPADGGALVGSRSQKRCKGTGRVGKPAAWARMHQGSGPAQGIHPHSKVLAIPWSTSVGTIDKWRRVNSQPHLCYHVTNVWAATAATAAAAVPKLVMAQCWQRSAPAEAAGRLRCTSG